uniref:Uncharacterized protein n=1 Tax=Anguilla anguilla TaxID=7936 RepID=A0A0E9XF31_ANGAN
MQCNLEFWFSHRPDVKPGARFIQGSLQETPLTGPPASLPGNAGPGFPPDCSLSIQV